MRPALLLVHYKHLTGLMIAWQALSFLSHASWKHCMLALLYKHALQKPWQNQLYSRTYHCQSIVILWETGLDGFEIQERPLCVTTPNGRDLCDST